MYKTNQRKKLKSSKLAYRITRQIKIDRALTNYQKFHNLNRTKAIIKLVTENNFRESLINDALYRKYDLSVEFLVALESALELSKGELLMTADEDINRDFITMIYEDIEQQYSLLDLEEAFYICEYFDYYMIMSKQTVDILYNYNELSNALKIKFIRRFSNLKSCNNILSTIENVKRIKPLLELSQVDTNSVIEKCNNMKFSSRFAKNKNVELSIKKHLWKSLSLKLQELSDYDLIKFSDIIWGIYTMDETDWKIAIGYEMLYKANCDNDRDDQKYLMNYIDNLLENEGKKTD
jgi:hypothetical protein